ncbi:MAG: hypothetical protein WA614_11140 [Acidimicrobiales bacterium]
MTQSTIDQMAESLAAFVRTCPFPVSHPAMRNFANELFHSEIGATNDIELAYENALIDVMIERVEFIVATSD